MTSAGKVALNGCSFISIFHMQSEIKLLLEKTSTLSMQALQGLSIHKGKGKKLID